MSIDGCMVRGVGILGSAEVRKIVLEDFAVSPSRTISCGIGADKPQRIDSYFLKNTDNFPSPS